MITRSEERIKQTGEVFTPTPLVNEILDKLPPELFTDPTKTFLDPACGDGQFLVEVVKRKLLNGSTKQQAIETTYGVDIMPDNIEICQVRLIKLVGDQYIDTVLHNIVCADSLNDWDFENWKLKHDQSQDLLDF